MRVLVFSIICVAVFLCASYTAAEPPGGLSQSALSHWPKTGDPSVGEVRDGYIVWNGKPFFRNLHHGWALWNYKHDLFQTYRYYLLCNVVSLGKEAITMARKVEEQGIEKATKDMVVWHRFTAAEDAYRQKVLMSMYLNSLQYMLPKSLSGPPTEEQAAKFDEYISGVARSFASLWKSHPDVGGYEISEEYWLPGAHGDDFFPPDSWYYKWLERKYGTVAKLNTERGESLNSFSDAFIPKKDNKNSGSGGPLLDYQDFLTEDNARRLGVIRDAIKTTHPGTVVATAKGEFGRATWDYAPPSDLFGWYCAVPGGYGVSNVIPRTAAEQFDKAFEIIHVNYCEFAKRDEPWVPGEKPGASYGTLGYAHTITELFEGMKQHWLEDYNDGSFHYFHPTKMIRDMGEVRTWAWQKLYFAEETRNAPDVMVEPRTLGMSAAFAWAQRAAPLFLPTKVAKGNIAVLMTSRSFSMGFSHDVSNKLWRDIAQALRRLQISYGLVREENLDDLKGYDVLIAGGPVQAVTPEFVVRIKAFVAGGGRLILLPRAFTLDSRTWKPIPRTRAEMEKLATVKLDNLPAYVNTPAKGETTADWPTALPIWRSAFDKAGVTTPAQLSCGSVMDASNLTLGLLAGKGYWLAGVASFDSRDRLVTLKLNALPAGKYEVADVTGERPLLKTDPVSGYVLAGDPEYRAIHVLTSSISSQDLAKKGIPGLEVKGGMGRILLVRPVGSAVLVSCPEYEVNTIALRKVGTRVVVGANASTAVRAAAERLKGAVMAAGGKAVVVVMDTEVKVKETRYEAVVQPVGSKEAYKMAIFNNAPLATDTNLILIGSKKNNTLIAHLENAGTFTYDKVFEKITDGYPGPGRGVIGVVESINDPSFDPTDQTRDALLVGGSEDAGTLAAMERLIQIVGRAR